MFKSLRLCITSLVFVAMCAMSAMAQSTTTGAINGTVSNPNKEVVVGASITAGFGVISQPPLQRGQLRTGPSERHRARRASSRPA